MPIELSSATCSSSLSATPSRARTRDGRKFNVVTGASSAPLTRRPVRATPPAHSVRSAATWSAPSVARRRSWPRSKRCDASERRLCRCAERRTEVGAKMALSMMTLEVDVETSLLAPPITPARARAARSSATTRSVASRFRTSWSSVSRLSPFLARRICTVSPTFARSNACVGLPSSNMM